MAMSGQPRICGSQASHSQAELEGAAGGMKESQPCIKYPGEESASPIRSRNKPIGAQAVAMD